jgi:hypothetical protein
VFSVWYGFSSQTENDILKHPVAGIQRFVPQLNNVLQLSASPQRCPEYTRSLGSDDSGVNPTGARVNNCGGKPGNRTQDTQDTSTGEGGSQTQ